MTGPNNYGNKVNLLVDFISRNPGVKREAILKRLGHDYLYSFNRAKGLKRIVPTKESTYKDKYWIVKGRRE
jgi:hypothetical protein